MSDFSADSFSTKEEDGHYVWRPCVNMQCYGDAVGEVHYHKAKLGFTADEWMDSQKALRKELRERIPRVPRRMTPYDRKMKLLWEKAFPNSAAKHGPKYWKD